MLLKTKEIEQIGLEQNENCFTAEFEVTTCDLLNDGETETENLEKCFQFYSTGTKSFLTVLPSYDNQFRMKISNLFRFTQNFRSQSQVLDFCVKNLRKSGIETLWFVNMHIFLHKVIE